MGKEVLSAITEYFYKLFFGATFRERVKGWKHDTFLPFGYFSGCVRNVGQLLGFYSDSLKVE